MIEVSEKRTDRVRPASRYHVVQVSLYVNSLCIRSYSYTHGTKIIHDQPLGQLSEKQFVDTDSLHARGLNHSSLLVHDDVQ